MTSEGLGEMFEGNFSLFVLLQFPENVQLFFGLFIFSCGSNSINTTSCLSVCTVGYRELTMRQNIVVTESKQWE
jgi:hypothetical protein